MPASVMAGLRKLGYHSFRPGQEQAVSQILSGTNKYMQYVACKSDNLPIIILAVTCTVCISVMCC